MKQDIFSALMVVMLISCQGAPQEQAAPAIEATAKTPTQAKERPPAIAAPEFGTALDTEFTPDSQRIIVSTTEKTIQIFEAKDGALLGSIKAPERIVEVDVSPDGRWIAASGRHAYVWSAADFTLKQTIADSNETLVFAEEGAYLTTAKDGLLYVWDLNAGEKVIQVSLHEEQRQDWLHTYSSYITANRSVQFWSIEREGQELLPKISTSPSTREGTALTVTENKTGKRLVTRDLSFNSIANTTLGSRWMLINRRALAQEEARYSLVRLNACQTECAAPKGGLRSCQTDCTVEDKLEVRELVKDLSVAALSSDGSQLFIAAKDGTITRWDTMEMTLLSTIESHQDINELEVSTDKTKLMSKGKNGTVKVWDLTTNQLLYTLDGTKRLSEPNKI